ncbi:hypothetical protein SCUCBS95973_008115 [Sporothrix curviconia]|uniref:Uncharacterized protein n=1 Tax=Sporothrix curviconia TaxID=1260050 RepID=A0ABP0CKR6_9PEZI
MASLPLQDLFSVKGYVAVVTGGSSGLGFMICKVNTPVFQLIKDVERQLTSLLVHKGLVRNGAKVYVVALPSEPIDECVAELNKFADATSTRDASDHGSAVGYACDVSNKNAIAELAAFVATHEGQVDLLVSNAGIRRDTPKACNVLTAPLAELQAIVPSKMNPVGAEGNMFSNLFDKMPAKRAGEEDDIAGAVLYLASCAGSYIDGINLCIDGGRVLLANGQE